MELYSRKKSRQDRMIHSKILETKEVEKVSRKEAGESRSMNPTSILHSAVLIGAKTNFGDVALKC